MRKVKQRIHDVGLVYVIRKGTKKEIFDNIHAACTGGISIVDINYTIEHATQMIKELKVLYPDQQVLFGAGTIMNLETCILAIKAGADFISSPAFNSDIAKYCFRSDILYIPGCMTITEMMTAYEYHYSLVNLFPCTTFHPEFIETVKGPLPYIDMIATGGINCENAMMFLKNGAFALGIGQDCLNGTISQITKKAKQLVEDVKEVRK